MAGLIRFILALAILGVSAVAGFTAFPDISEAAVFVVNTSDDADDGTCDVIHCSLREAINAANAAAGPDVIEFDSGAAPYIIQPGAALPTITDELVIDGDVDADGVPDVEIDGTNAGAGANGLHIAAVNTEVNGLVINRFDGDGILVEANAASIVGSYIGTGMDGSTDQGNGGNGVTIGAGVVDSAIGGTGIDEGNIIAFNAGDGVSLDASAGTG
ncbi:MAG: CSLREA domain-containing protein, partial [Chloroflexi bacterium]|nr:CSLREA domain-containing protein [Chloroflexota bacterium]